jgi:S-adenosylmethionine synthetase
MSFYVECEDKELSRYLTATIPTMVDLTPGGIIKHFDLFRPIYGKTTNYGHFGKDSLPWEKVDLF